MFNSKNRQAFSLVELSVVIIIIGILIAGISTGIDLYSDFKISTARNLTRNSVVPRINDLALWFESVGEGVFINQNNSPNIKDNENVRTWRSVGLQGFSQMDIGQGNASLSPKYVKNGINSLPSLEFNSTNNNMRMVGTLPNIFKLESTIFVVLNSTSLNASINQSYIFTIYGNLMSFDSFISSNNASSHLYNGAIRDHVVASIQYRKPFIYRKIYNSALNSSTAHINGILRGSATAGFSGFYGSNPTVSFVLGNHGTASRTFGGHFAEIIIYNRALNEKEVESIEDYLKKKWAIQS